MDNFSFYYWNDKTNVGDYYGYWLINKIFDQKYNFMRDKSNVDVVCCGSILTHDAVDKDTFVVGCGKHNFQDNEKFNGRIENVLAVRGKLTKDWLGIKNKIALGDPGLLVSLYYNPTIEQKYPFGIICHFHDIEFFTKKYAGKNVKIISTGTEDVEAFIREIKSCKFIFSTSLHGLIFSHAVGVPAVHLERAKLESKDNFKFKDYYSVLDIEYEKVIYSDSFRFDLFLNEIELISKYVPTTRCIRIIQKNLLQAFNLLEVKLKARLSLKGSFTSRSAKQNKPIINKHKDKKQACLCAIAKNENSYIREWVEHYLNIGFDKIFLYDNNDVDGERFDAVISDYIDNGFVSIIDVRGKSNQQIECYNKCYHTLASDYKWVAFFDIDEFLFIKNEMALEEFLNQPKFSDYDGIAFNWKYFDDNNLVHVDDRPVTMRFTSERREKDWTYAQHRCSKRILRTNLELTINSSHGAIRQAAMSEYNKNIINDIVICNTLGETIPNNIFFEGWTHEGAYLAHYRYKTIEEYICTKMKRGYPTLYKNSGKDMNLDDFFALNKITKEKIDCAIKLLKLNRDSTYKKYKISTTNYLSF